MPARVNRFLPHLLSALLTVVGFLAPPPATAQEGVRRSPAPLDIYRLREVSDPQVAPAGDWVAYVVTVLDSASDRGASDLWMTSWDGKTTIQLTNSAEGERSPRWSPDGRYLSFISSRQGSSGSQLWLLDRRGGEAMRVSDVRGGFSDYAWSPDSRQIAFISTDPDPAIAADSSARPRPIVIDRYLFKGGTNYYDRSRDHLYLFDVATRQATRLVDGPFEEERPTWSPDGRQLSFISDRSEPDPDRTNNSDVWIVDARPGATPRRLTSWPGPDRGPARWSPDGRTIAYRKGSEPRYQAYNLSRLAVIPVTGGEPRLLAPTLDRDVGELLWSNDGQSVIFTVENDRTNHLARVGLDGGVIEPLTRGDQVVSSPTMSANGRIAMLMSKPDRPPEVYALDGDSLRPLSRQNDAWLAGLDLPTTEGISARSSGGTVVNRRPGAAGRRRMELRCDPHQLRDRPRPPLQGGDQRRRKFAPTLHVRIGPVHPSVRPGDGPAVEEPRSLAQGLLPLLRG